MNSETLERLLKLCESIKSINGQLILPVDIDGIEVARVLKDAKDDLDSLIN